MNLDNSTIVRDIEERSPLGKNIHPRIIPREWANLCICSHGLSPEPPVAEGKTKLTLSLYGINN